MGIRVCKFYNQLKPRGPSTTCGSRLSARRMTRFKPAGKQRGSQGSRPVEAESRLPRGSCNEMSKAVSEMLLTANNLLQAAHQLLQQGPGVQGSRVEGAQVKKVDRVSVSCQTDADEEILEEEVGCVGAASQTSFEPEEAEISGAIWIVSKLKAQLEEEMVAHNDSFGYESHLSSLEDEENNADISSESDVLSLTTSS